MLNLQNPSPIVIDKSAGSFPWLLAYFWQKNTPSASERTYQAESLHFAYSWDGAHWTPINQNQPVHIPEIEGRPCNIRDPFIARGSGGMFHMVCVEFDKRQNSHNLLYTHSRELIHWEDTRRIPLMENMPQAGNICAPQFLYDPTQKDYVVFWSSTPAEKKPAGKQIWHMRTNDFQTFTPPQPLFNPDFCVIDAHIVSSRGKFYNFSTRNLENHMQSIQVAASDRMQGPYQMIASAITPAMSERPQVMRKIRPDTWFLYYDLAYTNCYGLSVSHDLIHWENVCEVRFPEDARHGSFFSIEEDELAALLWRFDFRFLVGRETLAQPRK